PEDGRQGPGEAPEVGSGERPAEGREAGRRPPRAPPGHGRRRAAPEAGAGAKHGADLQDPEAVVSRLVRARPGGAGPPGRAEGGGPESRGHPPDDGGAEEADGQEGGAEEGVAPEVGVGQKVNPYGFRIGFNKTWRSRWYASKKYAELLHEDLGLRKELKKRLG